MTNDISSIINNNWTPWNYSKVIFMTNDINFNITNDIYKSNKFMLNTLVYLFFD